MCTIVYLHVCMYVQHVCAWSPRGLEGHSGFLGTGVTIDYGSTSWIKNETLQEQQVLLNLSQPPLLFFDKKTGNFKLNHGHWDPSAVQEIQVDTIYGKTEHELKGITF